MGDKMDEGKLFNVARTAVDQRLARYQDDAGLARLQRASTSATQNAAAGSRRRIYAAFSLAAAAGAVVLGVGVTRVRPPSEVMLSYAREAEPALGATTATATTATRLRFSDGTTVSAPADSGIQVENNRQDKPRVRIKGRTARVHVVHRPETHWTFLAGPFEVLVTGTTFELGWDPTPGVLSLSLIEGAVTLRGPLLPGGALAVAAGQQVSIAVPTGAVTTRDLRSADSQAVPAAPPPVAPAPAAEPPPPAAEPTSPGAHRHGDLHPDRHPDLGDSWRDMVRRGEFERVIAAAHVRSRRDCETRCSADELRALGDAARYRNHTALAERAFRALRTRFASTGDGASAAYLLGRTYEARKRWAEADRWYATYLGEAPMGEFAVEAASGRARAAAHNPKVSVPNAQEP